MQMTQKIIHKSENKLTSNEFKKMSESLINKKKTIHQYILLDCRSGIN